MSTHILIKLSQAPDLVKYCQGHGIAILDRDLRCDGRYSVTLSTPTKFDRADLQRFLRGRQLIRHGITVCTAGLIILAVYHFFTL